MNAALPPLRWTRPVPGIYTTAPSGSVVAFTASIGATRDGWLLRAETDRRPLDRALLPSLQEARATADRWWRDVETAARGAR